jgi:hypothetical protein
MAENNDDHKYRAFLAYPSRPPDIGTAIRAALGEQRSAPPLEGIRSWEESEIAGKFIHETVLAEIKSSEVLIADVTRLNFNVTFEVGYAVGLGKGVVLLRNRSVQEDSPPIGDIGIFDTIGYESYDNSGQLYSILKAGFDVSPLFPDSGEVKRSSPVYIVAPPIMADAEIRLLSRIKKARINFRIYDPSEQGRLPAGDAIAGVSQSHAVIVPLLDSHREGVRVHNIRAAFVAGLSFGMGKETLLLQPGEDPVPLDYRDLVVQYKHLGQIDDAISDLAPKVTELLQADSPRIRSEDRTLIEALEVGASAAENEVTELAEYYLETDEHRRVLRGEAQVVVGRKGAGKTALFTQVRRKLRRNRKVVTLDLRPEGYQLLKFKERVLDFLAEGTREHTVTAFWRYLLLLEVCNKLIREDSRAHRYDHEIYELYEKLVAAYSGDNYIQEGDFAERMVALTERIISDFSDLHGGEDKGVALTSSQVTSLLYKHDVRKLEREVVEYLSHKEGLWVLFDNLDKGWPAHGLGEWDLLTMRCLLEALWGLRRSLERKSVHCRGVLFLRNDVYEHLVDNTPDRGKVTAVSIDWSDSDLLREILRKRFVATKGIGADAAFEEVWGQVAISHVQGEESSQYLIDRCLMRPRCLIDLFQSCRSHAVNLGHELIEVDDIAYGEASYSNNLIANISLEMRDVFPRAEDVLYSFIQAKRNMAQADLDLILAEIDAPADKLTDLLLWYGVLGFVRGDGDPEFIYSVSYDLKRMKVLMKRRREDLLYCVNPAFWSGLEIDGS